MLLEHVLLEHVLFGLFLRSGWAWAVFWKAEQAELETQISRTAKQVQLSWRPSSAELETEFG